jgi:uncharacterized membrane protein YgcG
MSDFSDAGFIPAQPPKKAIIDFSGTLTPSQVNDLQTQTTELTNIKPKVVVLPSDFHVDSMKSFIHELAHQWQVHGQRVLVVVSLKDKKVEMIPGKDLPLNSQVISQQILAHNFIPHMKEGDLVGAISSTLAATNEIVQERSQTNTASRQPSTADHPPAPPQPLWVVMMPWVFIAAVCAGGYMLIVKQQKKDNAKVKERFLQQVSPLYEQADQIGSASEYMKTADHPELAQRVALFFNKLTTFETAVREVEQLEKQNKVWEVRKAYQNLTRMIGLLMPEGAKLKEDVNAVTGGVETFKDPGDTRAALGLASAQADPGHILKLPENVFQSEHYRRPSWSYQPAYYQPFDTGLAGMLILMNQMQMMSMMSSGMHGGFQSPGWSNDYNSSPDDSGFGASGGADWGSDNSGFGDSGGASWGDSGGGDFGGGDLGGGDW